MKIALSVTKLAVGGIATTVLNLCPIFKAAGHEVTVIAQQPGARWPHLAAAGIQGYCLPQRSWESRVMRAKRLRAYLIEQQFDLLLVFIDFENRIPMLCLHELPDSLPVVLSLRSDFAAIYNLAAVNVEAWNCVVGVSPKVQHTAAQHFRHKTVHYIPNGFDFTGLDNLPKRTPWTTPIHLLYAGRLDDNGKGILRLPAILAQCRQQHLPVRLTIIGDGPDRAQLQQQMGDLDLLDLVEFWGTQERSTVLQAMRSHHLFLFLSTFEGFPNALLEAQANGCVPVAAHLPGITDVIVQHGSNGILVEANNTAAFVEGIGQLLAEERWQTYSAAGVQYATQHFSLQPIGEQYLALLAELQQGAYPLPIPRTRLRQAAPTPFRWKDYLPHLFPQLWRKYTEARQQVMTLGWPKLSTQGSAYAKIKVYQQEIGRS